MSESPLERVLNIEELLSKVEHWRRNGDSIVFTNGCFDILHIGHLQTLMQAQQEGTRLIVGLNSDDSVRRLKGETRPINTELERAQMLAALRCVEAVIIFPEDTPNTVLEALKPDVHVKGGDYRIEDLPEAEIVKKNGGRIAIINLVPNRSTTALIEKTKSQ